MRAFTLFLLLFSLAVGAVIGFLGNVAGSQEVDSIELAFAGEFLGPHAFPETGEGWFAVNQMPTGMTLTETPIEVSQVPHPCSGATRITAVDEDEPLFLVRGSSSFQSGPLDSVFEGYRFVYPAEALHMRLGSGTPFGFQAYGSAAPAVGEVWVSDYEIRHIQGTRTQTLVEYSRISWDNPPRLIWAGDLDRDGGPDVLLDLPRGDVGNRYVLFLSSVASSNQLVGRAAEFRASGC